MPAPDFSTYTEAQLRQVLRRIDPAKYPERVREITALLADPASLPPAAPAGQASSGAPVAMTIARPVRRTVAFLIDALLLAMLGWTAGLILHAQFAALGPWGVAVGFVVTVAYFGITESRFGDGRSLGKRILGLRVVSAAGMPLGTAPALCRTMIFCIAYFLNGAPLVFGDTNRWAAFAQSALTFAAIFSVPYLAAFNRRTGQSVHDLATGALVVRAGTGPLALPLRAIWRGHVAIIVATIAVMLAGTTYITSRIPKLADASSERTVSAIARIPGLGRPTMVMGTLYAAGTSASTLSIQVPVEPSVPRSLGLALQVVQAALDNLPDATRQQHIDVVLRSGYDIGIARSWIVSNYNGAPSEWRNVLASYHAPVTTN